MYKISAKHIYATECVADTLSIGIIMILITETAGNELVNEKQHKMKRFASMYFQFAG